MINFEEFSRHIKKEAKQFGSKQQC